MYAKLQNWIETNGIHLFYLVKRKNIFYILTNWEKYFYKLEKYFKILWCISWRLTVVRSRRKKVYQKEKYFKLKSRSFFQDWSVERFWNCKLAAFLTDYFVLLNFDDHTRFRFQIPYFFSQSPKVNALPVSDGNLWSLILKKVSEVTQQAPIKAPHSISTSYNFLENWVGRFSGEWADDCIQTLRYSLMI